MIIDASVLLSAFFPDEAQAQAQAILYAHASGQGRLKAPTLVAYEVSNAVWQAERRGRITSAQADEIMQTVAGLEIELLPLDWGEMLPLARQYKRSAYDAAYLTLAQRAGETLVTGDLHLYSAVKGKLDWVVWIGDYRDE
ncbi:MAG: type II toxin-antitoxin system VapC family toxin [Anaerolineales bacterium]|nr:type II toxin-antitoxin system VapC family toxin [Anaerolineales bacterium]